MPKIEMKPIAAETEKFTPVMSSASTPPVHATGMFMSTSERVDPASSPRCTTRNTMSRSVSGMMIASRPSASWSSLISPPHSSRVVGRYG